MAASTKHKNTSTVTERYELKFPASLKNISLVEGFLDNLCQDLDIGEEHYGNVLVAVTEAVNNAIKHGNQEDPSTQVTLLMEGSSKKLTFTIQDKGKGFDYENLPDPTAPENLEKPTGRGIFLMRQLADDVEFEDEGRTVTITFELNND